MVDFIGVILWVLGWLGVLAGIAGVVAPKFLTWQGSAPSRKQAAMGLAVAVVVLALGAALKPKDDPSAPPAPASQPSDLPTAEASPKPSPVPTLTVNKEDQLRILAEVSAPIKACDDAYTVIQKTMQRAVRGKATDLELYAEVQSGINACEENMGSFEKLSLPQSIQGVARSALEKSLKDYCPVAVGRSGSALRKMSDMLDQGGASLSQRYSIKEEIETAKAGKMACLAPFITQAMAAGATEKEINSSTGDI